MVSDYRKGENNSNNVFISEETKLFVKYMAMFSDLSLSINSFVEQNFCMNSKYIDRLTEVEGLLDEELCKILGELVGRELYDSNFEHL